MKHVALVIKPGVSRSELTSVLKNEDFSLVTKNPDFVLSVGGDGTFLVSERLYPGVPKAVIKESKICKRCHELPLRTLLKFIKQGKYRIEEHAKLEAFTHGKRLIATNDIVLRNRKQTCALRFSVAITGKTIFPGVIGDGVVIATPFGSTAYFHSITRKRFDKGFGLAFNNPTESLGPYLLKENAVVTITILRTNGLLSTDNNPKMIMIHEGDIITVRRCREKYRLFSFKKEVVHEH